LKKTVWTVSLTSGRVVASIQSVNAGAAVAKITFIARMTVREGREAEFVGLCRELEAHVRDEEPEVALYEFFKLREPRRYAVLESFPDEATEHRHMISAKLAELAPRISACLIGTWEREYFDPLEG
jgi:(4S)-4-hydroxy-5-phosphonooxypentane-2,3-dione isomerase